MVGFPLKMVGLGLKFRYTFAPFSKTNRSQKQMFNC